MKKFQILLTVLLFVFCLTARAGGGVESLSPELRALLNQEMVAIQEGMQAILPLYAAGNLDEVAEIAGKIKDSFILKQKITDEQRKELGEKLPDTFIRMDKKFHQYAGMLQHVAEMKHTELVGFYYSELTEACVACHTEYAKHRFPNLGMKSKHGEHHH